MEGNELTKSMSFYNNNIWSLGRHSYPSYKSLFINVATRLSAEMEAEIEEKNAIVRSHDTTRYDELFAFVAENKNPVCSQNRITFQLAYWHTSIRKSVLCL